MVSVSDTVAEALKNKSPVVALETAVLTSGLPRNPWQADYGDCPTCIDGALPINQALAHAMSAKVSEGGSVPCLDWSS